MKPALPVALSVLVLAGSGSLASAPQDVLKPSAAVEAAQPALVADLSKATAWRGNTYAASGTTLAKLAGENGWTTVAQFSDRVLALSASQKSLAAGGAGFVWVLPAGKKAQPVQLEAPGDWVALAPAGNDWCAISAQGELMLFSAEGIRSRTSLGDGLHLSDVAELWDQWWVVGHRRGQSLVLTATTPAGPWTEAPTGGKAPVLRIVGFERTLIAFGADGTAFVATEGGNWNPSRGWNELKTEPPTNVFASPEEGFVALTPTGLHQSHDGMEWVRLAYQDDPYGTRALVHGESGTVLLSQNWTESGLTVRREPVTPFATFQLAMAYSNGDGVPMNGARAVELYRKAAAAGVHRAQVELAFLIASGQVPSAPATEASAWYLLLCGEEGRACAPEEAFKTIEQLALKGRPEAQAIVAVLLRLGFGTKANSVEATAWTQIAEEHQANLYALDWYADPDDDPAAAKKRADVLRAKIANPSSTAQKASVSGTVN